MTTGSRKEMPYAAELLLEEEELVDDDVESDEDEEDFESDDEVEVEVEDFADDAGLPLDDEPRLSFR